jgi:2-polyprenyl-3-methyl-5-hydroxy-6-metoxy-1,4-benzoquinol methylase
VNKTVPLRFRGVDLRFHLSHALFSSFDVDDGTRLLLKSIAQNVDLGSLASILDVGCGVGVIGLCAGRHAPKARVVLQDRDALAVAFARENCRVNGLKDASIDCQLAFHGLGGASFDLVASNIPAKAGAPVLQAFFRHAAGCLSPTGTAAVVIVSSLASMARETINRLGCKMLHTEDARAYSVFHFAAGSAAPETDEQRQDLGPYIRTSASFRNGQRDILLETAYSLPDFDTLGRGVELALEVLESGGDDGLAASSPAHRPVPPGGSVLIWNPGQGHLAAALARAGGTAPALTVASRDCLECAITSRNLARLEMPCAGVHCIATEAEIVAAAPPSSVDLIVAMPHPVPRVPWQEDLVQAARLILKPGGMLLVSGTSTEMRRLLDRADGFALSGGTKRMGFRAVLLKKAAPPTRGEAPATPPSPV